MVTHLLYRAAGSPPMPGQDHGICRTCGADSTGSPFASWVRDTFTDHDKLTLGSIICHACQWCFSDRNEQIAARLHKDKPQKTRNYSHFVVRGAWHPMSKADKRVMRDLLAAGPEVAVIADSGQKHIIFRARPGWWQFEEATLRPFPGALERALAPVEEMYAAFTKSEIETGRYAAHRIYKFGLDRFRRLEQQIKPLRGTHGLRLALFLAQRDEEDDDARGDRGEAVAPCVARDPGGVQNAVRAKHLGAVRKPDQKRGLHVEPLSLF